jgi:thiol-disulfide isomerase/thioredoxin
MTFAQLIGLVVPLGLGLVSLAASPCQAQTPGSPEADWAEVEVLLEQLREQRDPDLRERLVDQLYSECDRFLNAHLEDGADVHVEQAGGMWLELAMRQDDVPRDQILARIDAFRARFDPLMPPRLGHACDVVESRLAVQPGNPAPPWRALDLHDESGRTQVRLRDYEGRLVLMDFWQSWCGPCLRLMETRLRVVHERWGSYDEFAFLGVSGPAQDDTADALRATADERGFTWRKVFDPQGDVQRDYGIPAFPYLVLIDTDGTILVMGRGFDVIDEIEGILRERLGPGEGVGEGGGGDR